MSTDARAELIRLCLHGRHKPRLTGLARIRKFIGLVARGLWTASKVTAAGLALTAVVAVPVYLVDVYTDASDGATVASCAIGPAVATVICWVADCWKKAGEAWP